MQFLLCKVRCFFFFLSRENNLAALLPTGNDTA